MSAERNQTKPDRLRWAEVESLLRRSDLLLRQVDERRSQILTLLAGTDAAATLRSDLVTLAARRRAKETARSAAPEPEF